MSIYKNGAAPYAFITNESYPLANTDFTFMAWMKITAATNTPLLVVARHTMPNRAIFAFRLTNSKCAIYTTIGSNSALPTETVVNSNGSAYTLGSWKHIALRKNGLNVQTFVDGVLTCSIDNTISISAALTQIMLFKDATSASSGTLATSTANVALVRLFWQSLTAEEITAEANSCSPVAANPAFSIGLRNTRAEVGGTYCDVNGAVRYATLYGPPNWTGNSDNPISGCWTKNVALTCEGSSTLNTSAKAIRGASIEINSSAISTTNPAFLRNANSSPKATSSLSANAELDVFGGESEGTSVCDAENF